MKKIRGAILLGVAGIVIRTSAFDWAHNTPTADIAHVVAHLHSKSITRSPELVKAWTHNKGEFICLEAEEMESMASQLNSAEYRAIARQLRDASRKLLSLKEPRKAVSIKYSRALDWLGVRADFNHIMVREFKNMAKQTDNPQTKTHLLQLAENQKNMGQELDKASVKASQKLKG